MKSSTLLGSEASDIVGQRRSSWRESLETGCAHPSGGEWEEVDKRCDSRRSGQERLNA